VKRASLRRAIPFRFRSVLVLLGCCAVTFGQAWSIAPGKGVGPITAATTRQSLTALFPSGKVVDDEIELDEGMLSPATFVYKGEPSRQLAVIWDAKSVQAHPQKIFICMAKRGSLCEWRAENGIGIGTRLQELEAKNGHPFNIAGFGWDYGGNVISWNGGALSKWGPKMSLVLTLDGDRLPNGRRAVVLTDAEAHSIQGNHQVSSDAPAMKKLGPKVVGMLFRFAPE
jgi:hypothetical protein